MKKILITGGAGFIGTTLIKRLVSEGHDVHSIDNYVTGTPNNHVDGCNYISGDVDSLHWMDDSTFDQCYHLAALSRIQPSFENPYEFFQSNTEGTFHVLEWARVNDVKVVYAGSSSKHQNPYQSPYATMKYLGEELCRMYRRTYKLDVQIARFYNVYGPGEITDDSHWAAIIGKWHYRAKKGLPLEIVGDGEQRRDFTHVDDIVDGLIRIMEHKRSTDNYIWELGTGKNYSMNEVYDMFRERFGAIREYVSQQSGNYRETLREDVMAVLHLDWKPEDRLNDYIQNL